MVRGGRNPAGRRGSLCFLRLNAAAQQFKTETLSEHEAPVQRRLVLPLLERKRTFRGPSKTIAATAILGRGADGTPIRTALRRGPTACVTRTAPACPGSLASRSLIAPDHDRRPQDAIRAVASAFALVDVITPCSRRSTESLSQFARAPLQRRRMPGSV